MKHSTLPLIKLIFFLVCIWTQENHLAADEQYIIVEKKNVVHKFVPFDEATDNFIRHVFRNWENETFDVFDKVKDPQSIAIDLGAWIGTTSIWLSKNFHHVVSVEADLKSIECLHRNLTASECPNVSICGKPILNTTQTIIFGPRESQLNLSTSFIKEVCNNENDYLSKSITLKQLIFDYVYANPSLENKKIAFIKCDIEGGEEEILEDILHFAYNNNCKVYRGSCKTPFGTQFALLASDSLSSQVAYFQSSMSTCEESEPMPKSSNWVYKASFATSSFYQYFQVFCS